MVVGSIGTCYACGRQDASLGCDRLCIDCARPHAQPPPTWVIDTITTPRHPRHPQYTVRSVECCEDPDDGMPPMPYALFVEGICREEAERICAELNRCGADPRAMVEPRHLAKGGV